MTQYRFQCCGKLATHKVCTENPCPFCGKSNPICEEIDKEDMVFPLYPNFSGDKKHEERAWGSFSVLLDEEGVKVKKIVVKSGQRLSLQLHKKRKELWYVIDGFGTMQIANDQFNIESGDKVTINKYEVHRVRNSGLIDLVLIEIQTGDCQENDIIRLEDDYGRE
jgi:mannose-6-phosphate isomerase